MTDSATAAPGAAAATTGRPGHGRSLPGPMLGVLGIVGFLGVWEVASRVGLVDSKYLPAASVVLRREVQNLGEGRARVLQALLQIRSGSSRIGGFDECGRSLLWREGGQRHGITFGRGMRAMGRSQFLSYGAGT